MCRVCVGFPWIVYKSASEGGDGKVLRVVVRVTGSVYGWNQGGWLGNKKTDTTCRFFYCHQIVSDLEGENEIHQLFDVDIGHAR